MKELYISPEAKLVSFGAAENIAVEPLNLGLGGDIHESYTPEGGGDEF